MPHPFLNINIVHDKDFILPLREATLSENNFQFHSEKLKNGMKSSAFFAFLAGFSGVQADGEAHVCAGCFVVKDHTGEVLAGDEDCDNDEVILKRWEDFQSGADGYDKNVTLSPHFFTCPASDTANFTSSCETTVFVQVCRFFGFSILRISIRFKLK